MIQRRYKWLLVLAIVATTAFAGTSLMDSSGNLRLQSLLESSDAGIVTFVSSPGTPSLLIPEDYSDALTYDSGTLTCRGATLAGDANTALATSSLVAGSIVLDGISVGDIEAGLKDSRHAKTLASIFLARLCPETEDGSDESVLPAKQTLVIPVMADELPVSEAQVASDVGSIFSAVSLECESNASLAQFYDLKIVLYTDPETIRSMAAESAQSSETKGSLESLLNKAYTKAKSSLFSPAGVSAVAQGMVSVGNVYSKTSHTVRAKLAAWKARVARGLVSDGFGAEAEALLVNAIKTFDLETIMAASSPAVASHRRELRSKLLSMMEIGIEEVFEGQIENLEKTSLKRLNSDLLKTVNEPIEKKMDSNAATLRNELHTFEGSVADLEVPSLGLTKEKAYRTMEGKLTDAVDGFEGSPAARIKRMAAQKKVVQKDKKPGQRAFDVGLDLVAVLRPDGFGSLQGFAGYQLGGNSITFGVHNDADDPQVIAQFGGVRPPLLRVQPKLRVDVEL